MTVTRLIFETNPALLTKLAFSGQTSEGQKLYATLRSHKDIERYVENSYELKDIRQFVERTPVGTVLDVGVGYGLTSAYLAIKGFDVVAIDPSLRLCEDMDVFFRDHRLPIHVVNGTAESMGMLARTFDAVIFCSSLCHCDDAPLALVNAHRLLVAGGSIFLREPVLKGYRSKDWFYQRIEEKARRNGHYGANEHIYTFGEHHELLNQAGFLNVHAVPSLNYRVHAKRERWDSNARYALKELYYALMRWGFLTIKPLQSFLAQASLLNMVMFAEKPMVKKNDNNR